MTTMTLRRVTLAAALLGLAGTGCGSCLDRDKPKKEQVPENQARTLAEYSKRIGKRTAAGDLAPDSGVSVHVGAIDAGF